jgi:hypothetical protein
MIHVYRVNVSASGTNLGWIPTSSAFNRAGFHWFAVHVLPNEIPRPVDTEYLDL